ncbi:MAG: STY4526/YPO1902 family pathogenicity island replication protein [Gammaproteobacteria bacterium]
MMRASKEAELNAAVLQYLGKCLAEGDDATLTHLGLDRQDAVAIESLYLRDLEHLTSAHFPLLREGSIDRDLFYRLIEHVRRQRDQGSVRDELLRLDAPLALMNHFFGMDSAEYAEHGRRLGLMRALGRPADPSEAEETLIWQALTALGKPDGEDLTAEECLALCKQTGVSPRTVWLVTHRASAAPPSRAHRSALSDEQEPRRKAG